MQVAIEQKDSGYVQYRTISRATLHTDQLLGRVMRAVLLACCSVIWAYVMFLCLQAAAS